PPGSLICEVGCGAGLFTNWLASEHPECRVVGVDAMPNLITAAQREPGPANREFALWDYTKSKPDSLPRFDRLVCSFGIDLGGDLFPESEKEFAEHHFRGWRDAAQDNAQLHTVLRIPNLDMCRAVVAGAQAAGWTLDLNGFEFVKITNERFPALSFVARESPPFDPDLLRSLWIGDQIKDHFPRALLSELATAFYELLADKQILQSGSKLFDCGNTMSTVIGTTHAFGFSYSTATNGFARLEIVPIQDVPRLRLQFNWDDPSQPQLERRANA
ncbi:MAG: class I SAM-dependent methyltransferase, partial [Planctomycetaceae bacterium]